MSGPAGGGTGLTMQDEVNVHFSGFAAQGADGIGAHGRAAARLEAAHLSAPVARGWKLRQAAVSGGKQQLYSLIGRQRAHPSDFRAAEGETNQRWAEGAPSLQYQVEQTIAGDLG